ncbi:MAG: universal stress protein [Bacteroidales bacterium]|nr:universal stress protein [Bacteroidales bacterium]
MIKHAILGTDFSKAISAIIDQSGIFKTLGIEKISLIHVLNLRDMIMVEKFTIEGLEKKLDDQKNILSKKGFQVTTELIYGIPYIELEKKRQELGAGLTIIGSHGRTSSSSTIGGTIADILQNMKAPVLVIPLKKKKTDMDEFPGENLYQYEHIMQQLEKQEPDWDLKSAKINDHILLPTDFSDFSEEAFQWIKNQQVKIPELTLFHVQDEVKIGKHLEHQLDEFNNIDSARLTRLKNAFQSAHPETEINIDIKYGKPTQVILNYIKENNVALTIMGSQGRGFFEEIFIGSVSHQVARNADSNILIIPIRKR